MAEKQMKNGVLKTGELLVREGLIRRDEIDNALSIQSLEAGEGKVPLGRILVKKGLISKTQILELAQHPLVLGGAGKLALERGLVTQEQFKRASVISPEGKTPGERLVAEGHLTVEALKRLVLDLLDSRELAGYLTALSLVSIREIRGILDAFRYPRSIGGILCGMNLVDPAVLYHLLAKHGKLMRLGELLVALFGIHRREVEKALLRKKTGSPVPLGRILVENKVITEGQLNFALSRQCNLPFEELTGFSFSRASRSKLSVLVTEEFAASSGIVPVTLEGSILTIAVSVPGCLLSMEKLSSENPFLRVRCVLISDRRFCELFSSLYGNAGIESPYETGKRLVAAAAEMVSHGTDPLSAGLDAFYGGVESATEDEPGLSAATEGEPRDNNASGKEPGENGHGDLGRKSNVVFLPVMEMEISDPEKEGIRIERMYRGYQSLRGGEATLSDLSLFRDFIRENHKRICDTFLCSSVTFNIESYGEKVMIQATPGRIG